MISYIKLDHQVNFEVNNPMATYRDIIKLFDFNVEHEVRLLKKINRLGIISNPSDIILDHQENFEVDNPYSPTGTLSNYLILVAHD